jgi:hypothetical protein
MIVQSSIAVAEFHVLDQFYNKNSSLEHQKNGFIDSIDTVSNKDSDSGIDLLDCLNCGHCHVMHFYITSELFSHSFHLIDKPLLRSTHGYSNPDKAPDNPPPIS